MALANYTEFSTDLVKWAEDRGDVDSDVISTCTRLAEAHFNREIRHTEMLSESTLTPSSGEITIPSGFVGVSSVVVQDSPKRVLNGYPRDFVETNYDTTVSGLACVYYVQGRTIRMFPKPTSDVVLQYYTQIPGLEANSTNWLFDDHPDIYMTAVQMEVYRYLKMDTDVQIEAQRLESMIFELNSIENSEFMANASRRISY